MSDRFIESKKCVFPHEQKKKKKKKRGKKWEKTGKSKKRRVKYYMFYDVVSNKQLKIKLPKDHLPKVDICHWIHAPNNERRHI